MKTNAFAPFLAAVLIFSSFSARAEKNEVSDEAMLIGGLAVAGSVTGGIGLSFGIPALAVSGAVVLGAEIAVLSGYQVSVTFEKVLNREYIEAVKEDVAQYNVTNGEVVGPFLEEYADMIRRSLKKTDEDLAQEITMEEINESAMSL